MIFIKNPKRLVHLSLAAILFASKCRSRASASLGGRAERLPVDDLIYHKDTFKCKCQKGNSAIIPVLVSHRWTSKSDNDDEKPFWHTSEVQECLTRIEAGTTQPEQVEGTVDDVLYLSLNANTECTNEAQEVNFIENQVLQKLQNAGWLKHGTRNSAIGQLREAREGGFLGNADHFLMAGGNKTVPIEFKPTHNLLVPAEAAEVVRRYTRALRLSRNGNRRTRDWVNIGHPVAQAMYYMSLGKSRYGVLSSGTRSYFFTVVVDRSGELRVLISDAWFVEQENYLLAWVCINHLAKENGHFQPPRNWQSELVTVSPATTPDRGLLEDTDEDDEADDDPNRGDTDEDDDDPNRDDTDEEDQADDDPNRDEPGGQDDNDEQGPNRDQPGGQEDSDGHGGADHGAEEPPRKSQKTNDQGSGAGGSATMQFMTWLDPGVAPSIPRVDGKDIKSALLVGWGNNLLAHAEWKGEKVALKLFDACKNLASFENEIRAYEHLKDAWGVLVPEPYFIADWRGFEALGMQLGRVPNSSDTEIGSERRRLFHRLRRDYGFEHLDQDPRNVIYLPDKSGKGKDHLVAIDLEAYEIRQ